MSYVWSSRRGIPQSVSSSLRPTWEIIFGRDLDQILDRALINRADGIDFVDTVYQTSFETGFSPNVLTGLFLASGLAIRPEKDHLCIEQETLF